MSLISILIPAYNCEKYIKKNLGDVLSRLKKNYIILVSDDHSTDNSVKIVKSIKSDQVILFEQKKNLGYLENMNFLFSKVETEFVALLDADDWCDPDRFEKQLAFLKNNPDYSIVGCSSVLSSCLMEH